MTKSHFYLRACFAGSRQVGFGLNTDERQRGEYESERIKTGPQATIETKKTKDADEKR